MSVNKYSSHVLVLPEDQANADIANGFLLHPQLNERLIQVLPPAGGWIRVINAFVEDHAGKMQQYPQRRFVLLIDFDKEESRLDYIKQQIPENVKDRVFVLGALSNPEELRSRLEKNFESIGESLSASCSDNNNGLWEDDLLKHNQAELERLITSVKPFLFRQTR